MPVSNDLFRKLLGQFASGVTVVTTRREDGIHWGVTVSAFCSVSLNPPLVLVCIGDHSESYPIMAKAEVFAVNILSDQQAELSRRFAAKTADKFTGVVFHPGRTGVAILDGCLGHVECRKVAVHIHGDHAVIVGEVLDGAAAGEGEPLLYFRGAYNRLQPADHCQT